MNPESATVLFLPGDERSSEESKCPGIKGVIILTGSLFARPVSFSTSSLRRFGVLSFDARGSSSSFCGYPCHSKQWRHSQLKPLEDASSLCCLLQPLSYNVLTAERER